MIPKRMQIEIVHGCNLRCRMCPISVLPNKIKVMPMVMYKSIIDQMEPYVDSLKLLDLFGIGEPLLDKDLCEKIEYAKYCGYQGTVFFLKCQP